MVIFWDKWDYREAKDKLDVLKRRHKVNTNDFASLYRKVRKYEALHNVPYGVTYGATLPGFGR